MAYTLATFNRLQNCQSYEVTKLSLQNCHFCFATKLSLPKCQLPNCRYQIVTFIQYQIVKFARLYGLFFLVIWFFCPSVFLSLYVWHKRKVRFYLLFYLLYVLSLLDTEVSKYHTIYTTNFYLPRLFEKKKCTYIYVYIYIYRRANGIYIRKVAAYGQFVLIMAFLLRFVHFFFSKRRGR